MEAVVFDLDGTLCNDEHRVHLAYAKRYDEYHTLAEKDEARLAELKVIRALIAQGLQMVIMTGRNERFRQLTINWLAEHNIYDYVLCMRPDKNYEPAVYLKMRAADHLKELGYEIIAAFEDDTTIVKAWRARGVTCFQSNERGTT